jgi:two-component system, chemotaxis family, chemotaxis protein CheY
MAINILIVEDSAVMREMIIRTLRLSNIPIGEIYQAANGQEGLDIINKNWLDLVLADINMPVMNGDEMIDKIRQNPATADLPVIIISTESSQTRIELLTKKSDGFVHKPFSPESLREAILNVIEV